MSVITKYPVGAVLFPLVEDGEVTIGFSVVIENDPERKVLTLLSDFGNIVTLAYGEVELLNLNRVGLFEICDQIWSHPIENPLTRLRVQMSLLKKAEQLLIDKGFDKLPDVLFEGGKIDA